MNMASLFRDTTDAERVVKLERQRFWLVVLLFILATLCAVLFVERAARFGNPRSSASICGPSSPSSASCGRVTTRINGAEGTFPAAPSRDAKDARGPAIAGPAGAESSTADGRGLTRNRSEIFRTTIIQNGRPILAIVVPFEVQP